MPGQALKSWQQAGLNLVSRLYGGRDVIFAIDLTESVGLNDEGRIRLSLIIAGVATKYLITLNKKWKLKISFPTEDSQEEQTCYLKNKQQIAIGHNSLNSIACPGEEIRGYLQRKGNRLYLIPTKTEPIFYREQEVLNPIKIERNSFRFNCPSLANNQQDFDINIRIIK